jgi:predicted DNA repair protein MutK
VLIAIAVVMTIGVYGLVAGIVKLDDAGAWLIARARRQAGLAPPCSSSAGASWPPPRT